MKSPSTTPAAEATKNDEVVSSSEPTKQAVKPWWADQLGKPGETYSDCGGRKLTDIGG